MRVFITGIIGFLGSHLADHLAGLGHAVTGCDDFSTGDARNIKSDTVSMVQLDVSGDRREALVDAMHGCEVVYHCAAAAYEGLSVFSPGYISTNIYAGSANVYSAAIQARVKRIVNCSSMARYGNGIPPFREDDITLPVDPYGLAKVSAEWLLKMLSETHDIEYVIAVPHNIYGPRQKYDDPYRNVAAIMTNRALQGKQPIIYGDGQQVRCFSYVSDVVPCLARMGFERNVVGKTINLGPDQGEINIKRLAQMVCSLTGLSFDPIYVPGRPCEVKHATCSARRARSLLGFEAKIPLEVGLTELVRDISDRGPKPFVYRLPTEIVNDKTPRTWVDKLI